MEELTAVLKELRRCACLGGSAASPGCACVLGGAAGCMCRAGHVPLWGPSAVLPASLLGHMLLLFCNVGLQAPRQCARLVAQHHVPPPPLPPSLPPTPQRLQQAQLCAQRAVSQCSGSSYRHHPASDDRLLGARLHHRWELPRRAASRCTAPAHPPRPKLAGGGGPCARRHQLPAIHLVLVPAQARLLIGMPIRHGACEPFQRPLQSSLDSCCTRSWD